MKKLVMAFLVLIFSVITAYVQSSASDVLYLKNGSIIKGTIVELEVNSTVKIRTSDGSIFVYPMSEVQKIVKTESDESPRVETNQRRRQETPVPVQPKQEGTRFELRGGLFLSLQSWNKLQNVPPFLTSDDSKMGFGLMGLIAGGANFGNGLYLGAGPNLGYNFFTKSKSISSVAYSYSIGVTDFGMNFVFGVDDMFVVAGAGSSSVGITSTVGGSSDEVEVQGTFPFTRITLGWGDTYGFAFSFVSYSTTNLSRVEFALGFSF
jgi:hypothetical protein